MANDVNPNDDEIPDYGIIVGNELVVRNQVMVNGSDRRCFFLRWLISLRKLVSFCWMLLIVVSFVAFFSGLHLFEDNVLPLFSLRARPVSNRLHRGPRNLIEDSHVSVIPADDGTTSGAEDPNTSDVVSTTLTATLTATTTLSFVPTTPAVPEMSGGSTLLDFSSLLQSNGSSVLGFFTEFDDRLDAAFCELTGTGEVNDVVGGFWRRLDFIPIEESDDRLRPSGTASDEALTDSPPVKRKVHPSSFLQPRRPSTVSRSSWATRENQNERTPRFATTTVQPNAMAARAKPSQSVNKRVARCMESASIHRAGKGATKTPPPITRVLGVDKPQQDQEALRQHCEQVADREKVVFYVVIFIIAAVCILALGLFILHTSRERIRKYQDAQSKMGDGDLCEQQRARRGPAGQEVLTDGTVPENEKGERETLSTLSSVSTWAESIKKGRWWRRVRGNSQGPPPPYDEESRSAEPSRLVLNHIMPPDIEQLLTGNRTPSVQHNHQGSLRASHSRSRQGSRQGSHSSSRSRSRRRSVGNGESQARQGDHRNSFEVGQTHGQGFHNRKRLSTIVSSGSEHVGENPNAAATRRTGSTSEDL
ncbi:MAG: hypothetical protein M1837_001897 [Sclerophora amabilis]|nr:MAG: hypothetical protein M1837_001897 [Sclerophora amabilis]